VTIL
jgi:myosin heavy subunit